MQRSASMNVQPQHKDGWMPLPTSESMHDMLLHAGGDYKRPAAPGSDAGTGPRNPLPGRALAYRAKKIRLMKWIVLHASGGKQIISLDKRQLIQHFNLDIPVRDMRLLDQVKAGVGQAVQGSSGQLLVRDNAMLLSMEYIKMIITADKAILPVPEDKHEAHDRFVSKLESNIHERLAEGCGASQGGTTFPYALNQQQQHLHQQQQYQQQQYQYQQQQQPGTPPSPLHGNQGQAVKWPQPMSQRVSHSGSAVAAAPAPPGQPRSGPFQMTDGGEGGDGMLTPRGPLSQQGTGDELSFELHCLEAGLGEVCRHLAKEAEALQAAANPALEDLVSSSDRRNLERVRRIKTLHQRLLARVALVRDTLNKLMEDDADMFRMCLSRATQRKPSPSSGQIPMAAFSPRPSSLPSTTGTSAPPPAGPGASGPAGPTAAPATVPVPVPAVGVAPRPSSGIKSAFAALDAQAGGVMHAGGAQGAGAGAAAPQGAGAAHAPPPLDLIAELSAGEQQQVLSARSPRMSMDIPATDPASMYAFGSASLRSASMLALKLRHMQNMAAATAAADAVSRGGPEHTVTTLPALVPPVSPLPGQMLLDEDDLHDVLDVENLLEAYAQMADATHTTLVGLGEYVEATEDLVNINLDWSRNNLIRFELLITMGTFSLAFYSCVAGVLGENLVLPEWITQDITGFVLINVGMFLVSVLIFYWLVQMIRKQGLMASWR